MAFNVRFRRPIAIVGGSDPTDHQYEIASAIAERLAEKGWPIICGGRTGIMQAAAEGAHHGGGICVGILPDLNEATAKQSTATLVIPTDLGNHSSAICEAPNSRGPRDVSRNRIIVGSALCVVAVGGGSGTANEIKLALQFGKTVIRVAGAPAPQPFDPETEPPPKGKLVSVDSSREAIEEIESILKTVSEQWRIDSE